MQQACRLLLVALFAAAFAAPAQAWWNKDWTQRTRVVVDTSAKGVETRAPVAAFALALRLHAGNFDFAAAREDGADLRVVAADDKTPLQFQIERFDPINELAVLWVQLPNVTPGSDANVVHVYAGNARAAADAAAAASGFDAATLAAFHFGDANGSDASGALKASTPPTPETNALLGGGARLAGTAVVWPAGDRLQVAAGGALTWSLWIKADAADGTLLEQGPIVLRLAGGRLAARIGATTLGGGEVRPALWTQVALALGQGRAALFVNGTAVAQAEVQTPDVSGDLRLGQGLRGAVDELEVASVARSADWLLLAAASQGVDGKLVRSQREDAAAGDGSGGGYFGILFANLTTDAWVVIGILAVMFVIAAWVMVSKGVLVARTERANRVFVERFRLLSGDLLAFDGPVGDSPLYRLYKAGVRELAKRETAVRGATLSGASLDAVKAAVDADMVRETSRLNASMVLLTIAISGGPFLGLLGTVVGVMITFAAIAAAGDVNVNAIAPGIAAALLATVAGLAVAIPALFGYNYLASRIRTLAAEMQIFVDEFITRVAETYGQR